MYQNYDCNVAADYAMHIVCRATVVIGNRKLACPFKSLIPYLETASVHANRQTRRVH